MPKGPDSYDRRDGALTMRALWVRLRRFDTMAATASPSPSNRSAAANGYADLERYGERLMDAVAPTLSHPVRLRVHTDTTRSPPWPHGVHTPPKAFPRRTVGLPGNATDRYVSTSGDKSINVPLCQRGAPSSGSCPSHKRLPDALRGGEKG